MAKEKLFNAILNGITHNSIKQIDVSQYDISNIKINKINDKDVESIAKRFDINYDEYKLFLQFVNKEKVEYNKSNMKLIMQSKRLIAYALNDEKIPEDVKTELSKRIDKLDNYLLNKTDYKINTELPSLTYCEESGYFEGFEPEKIDDINEFYKEKESWYQKAINHQIKTGDDISDVLIFCRKVSDAEFKKLILKEVSDKINNGSETIKTLANTLYYEKDKEVLDFVFENCTDILFYKPYTWMEGYKASIIYQIQDHPLIDEKMANHLKTKILHPKYCTENKMDAAVGAIIARCGAFSDKEYEYFCNYPLYDRITYKNDVNCATVVEAIVKSPKTPQKFLEALTKSENDNIKLMALMATAIKPKVSDAEFAYIMNAYSEHQFESIYHLNDDVRTDIYNNVVYKMKDVINERDCIGYRNKFLSALREDNKVLTNFNENFLKDIKERFGYVHNDDYEFLYIVEQKLCTSNEYKYINAERKYIKEINNDTQPKIIKQTEMAKRNSVADDVLANDVKWISIISDITDDEIER